MNSASVVLKEHACSTLKGQAYTLSVAEDKCYVEHCYVDRLPFE